MTTVRREMYFFIFSVYYEYICMIFSSTVTWQMLRKLKFFFSLFYSNLTDVEGVKVLANVEIVRFLQNAVQYFPEKLSDKSWDFILCTAVSLIQVTSISTHTKSSSSGHYFMKVNFQHAIFFSFLLIQTFKHATTWTVSFLFCLKLFCSHTKPFCSITKLFCSHTKLFCFVFPHHTQ